MQQDMQQDIIGLIPAGGSATRLSPLPMSKELYPIGFQRTPLVDRVGQDHTPLRPKVVSQYLLEKLEAAGIQKVFLILRPGKWDIPAYFGDGSTLGLHLAYLTVHVPHGVPYTLDQAFPFVQDHWVALGFPDTLFQPEDAFARLRDHRSQSQADVILGAFPTQQFWKVGMVAFEADGRVTQVVEKPQQTDLTYMWAIALWSPRFTQFLHEYVQCHVPERELPIGDVVQAAIRAGLRVEAVPFEEGNYLDAGTPEDLMRAIHGMTIDNG